MLSTDYTGLAAVAWELFSRQDGVKDLPFYRSVIAAHPGRVLDVGCASGRTLLPLLADGIAVDGIDPSADLLDACRRLARDRGLPEPRLHCQSMQRLDLPERYAVIFVPCGTIQLVLDPGDVREALHRLRRHLAPGGALVLTVFNRWKEMSQGDRAGEWVFRARRPVGDGTEVEKHYRVSAVRLLDQTLTAATRYRRYRGGQLVEEQECEASERWFYPNEMGLLLERAGFARVTITRDFTDAPPSDDCDVLCYVAH